MLSLNKGMQTDLSKSGGDMDTTTNQHAYFWPIGMDGMGEDRTDCPLKTITKPEWHTGVASSYAGKSGMCAHSPSSSRTILHIFYDNGSALENALSYSDMFIWDMFKLLECFICFDRGVRAEQIQDFLGGLCDMKTGTIGVKVGANSLNDHIAKMHRVA